MGYKKFRLWDEENKFFWYSNKNLHFVSGARTYDLKNTGLKIESLEQFTDLKDKTGKEIYEGDICEMTNTWTVFKRVAVFKDSCFGFQGTNGMFIPNQDLMEIIGNIHENPELLTDK